MSIPTVLIIGGTGGQGVPIVEGETIDYLYGKVAN
jgi:hypothetical protein